MEAIAILLFLILIVLYFGLIAIERAIMGSARSTDLSGVEIKLEAIDEHLGNMFSIMGGEEKLRKYKAIERKKLRKRLIDLLQKTQTKPDVDKMPLDKMQEGSTVGGIVTTHISKSEASNKADKLLEEAEFEESHSGSPWKFDQLYKWVIAQEIERRENSKYGKFTDKFRDYLKGKTTIPAYSYEVIAEESKIDYDAVSWLIKKMIQEKRLIEVNEYKDGYTRLKHYEVLKLVKQA